MEFQQQLIDLKREIRDLKTAHDSRSNMKTFFSQITVPYMESFHTTTIRVTYADGTQPILTTIVGQPEIVPQMPNGNTQDFIIASGDSDGTYWETDVYFLSSRKIQSVQIL